jgi:hypothetical protein
MPQLQFNKGIIGLADNLTGIITEKPYYLKIKIINLVFTDGFTNAAKIVIDIADKDKLLVANYMGGEQFPGFRTIVINKEYEFITSEFILKIDENEASKFNFNLNYENINV